MYKKKKKSLQGLCSQVHQFTNFEKRNGIYHLTI